MARKYVKSRPGLFGMVYYYDDNGKPIGKSRPGLIEGTRVSIPPWKWGTCRSTVYCRSPMRKAAFLFT